LKRFGLILFLLASGVLEAGCQSPPPKDTMLVVHSVRFTSFARKLPPARAGYAPTVSGEAWGKNTSFEVSGYDYMHRFAPGAPITSAVVFHQFTISGVHTKSVLRSCDTGVPFKRTFRAYFAPPNDDVHAKFFLAESRMHEVREGQTTYVVLPGTPPPIPAGENAVLLDKTYFDSLAPGERDALANAPVRFTWRHVYDYDGCNRAHPGTPCGNLHCLAWLGSASSTAVVG
jgi:hypothetical protein